MKIEEIKKYIADDGKEFDNEHECVTYELVKKGDAEYMLGGIPHKVVAESGMFPYCGSDTYGYLLVRCRDTEDVKRLKEWLDYNGFGDTEVLIGSTILVEVYFNNEDATLKGIENVNEVYYMHEFVYRLCRPFHTIESYLEKECAK